MKYLTKEELVAGAGGDPWEINRTLQAGQPGQIASLASAFHGAGRSTAEADHAFQLALNRFNAAWNRQNGDHPINDAAEVQRTAQALGAQSEQLPKIGADLENIAAALAEAQKSGAAEIASLEGQLDQLDHLIDLAMKDLQDHPDAASQQELHAIIKVLKAAAVSDTKDALDQLQATRHNYSDSLHQAQTNLANDGYDPGHVLGVDGHEAETPEQAEKDVKGALAGDKGAAARVNGVLNSITPDQRAGKVPLTAEQASVLSQLQAQEHGMSIDALNTAEQRLGDEKGMIGNSWQLMSNPNLTFPKTPLQVGAKQGTETIKGGAAQLPESVQQALNSSGLEYMRQTNDIANIVKDGDKSFQTNTDLDRAMIRKAGAMMDTPLWQHDPASQGQNVERDPAMDPAVSNVLSAVSPDHQVVHDSMTGGDHDKFLRNLTHHAWKDNGQAVGSLFSWTGDAAQGPEAKIAAETAHAYSAYVGSHEQDLLHLPGNHTLGQVNPNLVQGMAHGLTPYVNNIAGISGGLADFAPLDTGDDLEGRLPIAKGVFSVMSSDKAASDVFNGAADQQALLDEAAYGRALANHTPDMNGYNADLGHAGTLRGLVAAGIHNSALADAENNHTTNVSTQAAEYDQRKSAYEYGKKLLSTGTGLVPGVGKLGGPGVDILGSSLENDFIGSPPTSSPPPTGHPLPDMTIGRADREILNSVIASGQRVDGLSQYMVDGRIGSLADLASQGKVFDPDQYSRDLNHVLTNVYGQNSGTGGPVIADLDMTGRYNAVVKDPDPQHP